VYLCVSTEEAFHTARWYSSWILLFAYLPVVCMYMIWIPLTVNGALKPVRKLKKKKKKSFFNIFGGVSSIKLPGSYGTIASLSNPNTPNARAMINGVNNIGVNGADNHVDAKEDEETEEDEDYLDNVNEYSHLVKQSAQSFDWMKDEVDAEDEDQVITV
jgi:hypothetical protein